MQKEILEYKQRLFEQTIISPEQFWNVEMCCQLEKLNASLGIMVAGINFCGQEIQKTRWSIENRKKNTE